MKKSLAILLIFIMIFLPSCGKKIKKENVTPSRPNCTVSASYNGIDCSARINYDETGRMTVEMLSPIKGMTLSVDDSGCRLGYDGMEIDYTTEQVKGFCPFIGLYSVLKTVCYTVPESARMSGDSYILKYRTPETECTAISNKNDGKIREIEADKIRYIFQ